MYICEYVFVSVAGSLRHDIDPSLCGWKPLCAKLPEGKGGATCNHPEPGETIFFHLFWGAFLANLDCFFLQSFLA